jgi:NADPH:quinone reductase-like Zn-dependent oxidoreductase
VLQLGEGLLDDGEHDGRLVGEVPVDRWGGDAHAPGDGSQGDVAFVPGLIKQVDGGGDDVVAQAPGKVEPSGLQVRTQPLPALAAGQVLLRMDATGVSFAEQQMRRGKYYDQPPFPFVPGYDVVGTVTAVGPDVDNAMVGRRFATVTKIGAWAGHLHLDSADLVPVPEGVDPAAVETLLMNGITAWQMPHRMAKVRPERGHGAGVLLDLGQPALQQVGIR